MTTTIEHPKTALARQGEQLAADYLVKKGFTILERNYRIGQGEMDIIARHGNWLVVVEVKTRESDYLTDPLQLVPMTKQKQLIKLANYIANLHSQAQGGIKGSILLIKRKAVDLISLIKNTYHLK